MINPFIICDVAQQAIYRRYADRENWIAVCLAYGGNQATLMAYDANAVRYARTTIYPNEDVVAYCRMLARDALARGESLPVTAEQAIERAERLRLQEIVERLR